jgi:hypothetical protein
MRPGCADRSSVPLRRGCERVCPALGPTRALRKRNPIIEARGLQQGQPDASVATVAAEAFERSFGR